MKIQMKTKMPRFILLAGALAVLMAPGAEAACAAGGLKSGFAKELRTAETMAPEPVGAEEQHNLDFDDFFRPSVVGLWNVTFYLGNGPAVYDQGFEQWHSDGTELLNDNAVPPSLGNVCVGVWKQTGIRTYKLRHLTFNWDLSGNLTGTFVLLATVTVDPSGNGYTGTFKADSYDLAGKLIPSLHADGTIRAKRITVE